MADEAAQLGMGEGTVFVVSGLQLFGMVNAAAAQAAVADREAGGQSVIAYADGVKSWFEANPHWVPRHLAEHTFTVHGKPMAKATDSFGVVLMGPIEHLPAQGGLLVAVPEAR